MAVSTIGLLLYPSYYEAMEAMTEEEQLLAFNVICKYAFYDEQPTDELPQMVKMWFMLIKPTVDANLKKRVSGSLGGRKKTTQEIVEEELAKRT